MLTVHFHSTSHKLKIGIKVSEQEGLNEYPVVSLENIDELSNVAWFPSFEQLYKFHTELSEFIIEHMEHFSEFNLLFEREE